MIAAPLSRPRPLPGRDPRAVTMGGLLRRLSALAVAALVAVSALTAGRSYLWCSMMERAVEACCCEPAPDDETPAPDGAQIHSACCEDHAYAHLAKARVAGAPVELPAATLVAIALPSVTLPAPIPAPAFAPARAPQTRALPIRAGPPSAADTCIRLQVFRC